MVKQKWLGFSLTKAGGGVTHSPSRRAFDDELGGVRDDFRNRLVHAA
jgi:hypothetical protein